MCIIKFALFDFSKTAIAIDTIINQKKFNEGTDESKSLVLNYCMAKVSQLIFNGMNGRYHYEEFLF